MYKIIKHFLKEQVYFNRGRVTLKKTSNHETDKIPEAATQEATSYS